MASTAPQTQLRNGGEKLGAAVAREIETEIIDRGWPVGEVLGSEGELIQQFGVSRAVFREAVRLLEHRQVAAMRRGPGGGLVVAAPPAAAVVEVIATYLDFVDVSTDELSEARRALEQVTAGLAAERITEDAIHQLRELLSPDTDTVSAGQFHVAIAEQSANPALALFVRALTVATGYRVDVAALSATHMRQSHAAHEAIVNAIASGQAGIAEHLMSQHVGETSIPASRRARARQLSDVSRLEQRMSGRKPKLPEQIAHRIKADIMGRRWPVGEVVGSEPDLLETYDVSRAVLREAIRILEYYGVAKMRRGPGGGLVVTEPDLARIVDVVTLYLEYLGIDRDRLHEARDAIELTTVVLAAERMTSERARRLEALLDAERTMAVDEVADVSQDFHLAIAELAGNKPLEFFTHVVTRLTSTHVTEAKRSSAAEREVYAMEVARTHARIAEAVIGGDAGLARHRMIRHLAALSPYLDTPRPR